MNRKSKYRPGGRITDWRLFVQSVLDGDPFYFHDDLTDSSLAMMWQLSTIIRYCSLGDGTLKWAIKK